MKTITLNELEQKINGSGKANAKYADGPYAGQNIWDVYQKTDYVASWIKDITKYAPSKDIH